MYRVSKLVMDGPTKTRRIARACDDCHRRSIRCRASQRDPRKCQNCYDFAQPCTYERPVKRRGARPKENAQVSASDSGEKLPVEHAWQQQNAPCSIPSSQSPVGTFNVNTQVQVPASSARWMAKPIASQATVIDLVEAYIETVYPMLVPSYFQSRHLSHLLQLPTIQSTIFCTQGIERRAHDQQTTLCMRHGSLCPCFGSS